MSLPENISLQITLNADPPATGAVDAAFEDSVVLSLVEPAGVRRAVYRIWEYPDGFACPAGWTEESGGSYKVTTQNGAAAPAFDLPSLSPVLWGKYFFSVEVNERKRDGVLAEDLFDDTTALAIPSTSGVRDVGFGETNQFDERRQWAGALKDALRAIDGTIAFADGGALPDSNSAINVSTGARFTLTDPTGARQYTPALDGPAGLIIFIEFLSNANTQTCSLVNSGPGGGSTPLDTAGYGYIFQFDGDDWAPIGVYLLP